MSKQRLTTSLEKLIIPFASELVFALMRSYPLVALMSGDLLIPKGCYDQPIDDNYVLDGNLHSFSDEGPWHEAKAIFRLCIHSRGTALERRTLINCWFEYRIFDRALSNFHASELDENALQQVLEKGTRFQWEFGRDTNTLRY